jgi:hypothetical protein
MEPDPFEESGPTQRPPHESDASAERTSLPRGPELRVEDDGTVPEKQVSRWTNEGGSWRPVE